jgi:hypothetical protein
VEPTGIVWDKINGTWDGCRGGCRISCTRKQNIQSKKKKIRKQGGKTKRICRLEDQLHSTLQSEKIKEDDAPLLDAAMEQSIN